MDEGPNGLLYPVNTASAKRHILLGFTALF